MGLREKLLGRAHENIQKWQANLFREYPRPSDIKLVPGDVQAWRLRELQTAVVIGKHLASKGCTLMDLEKYLTWQRQAEERRHGIAKLSLRSGGRVLSRADIKHRRAEARLTPAQRRKRQRREELVNGNT